LAKWKVPARPIFWVTSKGVQSFAGLQRNTQEKNQEDKNEGCGHGGVVQYNKKWKCFSMGMESKGAECVEYI
jgi:hypothetical protein